MTGGLFVVLLLALLVLIIFSKTAVVVPQQSAYVVERLGKYAATLDAGFHILLPFIDRIRYKHSLKETAIDIPEQVCITRDNVQVSVDGILYLKVLNPQRASYGIRDSNASAVVDRNPRCARSCVQQRVEQRPICNCVRSVFHTLGFAERGCD